MEPYSTLGVIPMRQESHSAEGNPGRPWPVSMQTRPPEAYRAIHQGLNRGINRELMENRIFQFLGHFN